MIDRNKNRSDSYQYILIESPCSPDILTEVADAEGVHSRLNAFGYNEELLDLKEKLKEEFWRLVDENLTERQVEVLHLVAVGKTQTEIAKKLGVNQSSITKSINGNCDYRSDKGKRSYGGSLKRISKLVATDKVIQQILNRIQEISSDNDY